MATSVMNSVPLSLKPSFTVEKTAVRGVPSLARTCNLTIKASKVKKIKTDSPYELWYIIIS